MITATLGRDALMPRPPGGMGQGLVMALLVHSLLLAALALGVQWHAREPEGVDAELWAAVPQIAAPKVVEPEPEPPKPQPPEPPKPVPQAEPQPDAQIAIEKAKREERDRKKKEEAEKAAEKRKLEQEEQRKKELEDRKLAALHEQQMKRIMGQAGAGEPAATGTSSRSAGPSASYLGRVIARIKPHVQFPVSTSGDPAEVTITVAPDGTILTYRIAKTSGAPAFDEAALRAVQETAVLPRDTDGSVPSPMTIVIHRPGT